MDFGFVFMGSCQVTPQVKHAEDRGYSHGWLYDSQMLGSEVYASLALCAAAKKINKITAWFLNLKNVKPKTKRSNTRFSGVGISR